MLSRLSIIGMSDDDKKVVKTTDIPAIRVGVRARNPGMIAKGQAGLNRSGRPKGVLNKITRTMKDAVIAAADELVRRAGRCTLHHCACELAALHRWFVADAGPLTLVR